MRWAAPDMATPWRNVRELPLRSQNLPATRRPGHAENQSAERASGFGGDVIGSPETVAAKLRLLSDALGGVSRVNLRMSSAAGDQVAMLRSITLLGQRVARLSGESEPANP